MLFSLYLSKTTIVVKAWLSRPNSRTDSSLIGDITLRLLLLYHSHWDGAYFILSEASLISGENSAIGILSFYVSLYKNKWSAHMIPMQEYHSIYDIPLHNDKYHLQIISIFTPFLLRIIENVNAWCYNSIKSITLFIESHLVESKLLVSDFDYQSICISSITSW